MFVIVAQNAPVNPTNYYAVEKADNEKDDMVRRIDLSVRVAYPPIKKYYYLSQMSHKVDESDNPLDLDAFLASNPDITNFATKEQFREWYKDHPEAWEPPVEISNTLLGNDPVYQALETPEDKEAYFRVSRDEWRARRARLEAKS